jgi:hypothetical protein
MKYRYLVAPTGATLLTSAAFVPVGAANNGQEPTSDPTSASTALRPLAEQEFRQGEIVVRTYGGGVGAEDVQFLDSEASPGDSQGEAGVSVRFGSGPETAGKAGAVEPTIYEMTLASGYFTPEEACEYAKGFDEYGCRTSAQVAADLAQTAVRPVSVGDIYDSRCFDFETFKGDGRKWSHNCNVRRIDTKNSRNVWIANQMTTTGGEDDTGFNCDCISGVGMRVDYENSGSEAVAWQPSEVRPYSECRQDTTTVQGLNGASYSSAATICEDKLGPWNSPKFQYFGSKWKGPEAPRNDTRSAIATSLQQILRPGTRDYKISAWIRWG